MVVLCFQQTVLAIARKDQLRFQSGTASQGRLCVPNPRPMPLAVRSRGQTKHEYSQSVTLLEEGPSNDLGVTTHRGVQTLQEQWRRVKEHREVTGR